MDWISVARRDYKEYLELHKADLPDGLLSALKTHERVPLFIDNLAKELQEVQARGLSVDRVTIKNAVYDLTATFIETVKAQAETRQLSELEKIRRKEAQKTLDEKISDISNELDVK